jgi:tetratricopeptide (TPR) repeat protein
VGTPNQRARGGSVPGYRDPVSSRGRVVAVVAVAAVAAGAGIAALALAQREDVAGASAAPAQPRPGSPPVSLDLGVRTDPEAVELRRALRLYREGHVEQARALFARHRSLEARVGEVMTRWPEGTVDRLEQLQGLHPSSAVVALNLGLALVWAGEAGAEDAWRATVEAEPDSPYAVAAANLLHPGFARDLPVFVQSRPLPASISRLPPPQQLRELERRARAGSTADRIAYGVALQQLGKPLSAEAVFAAAAKRDPDDAEAAAAAAVGRFDKADPAAAFSRLGPLTQRFPRVSTVRFHLGLLLLWSGEVKEARRQLGLARDAEPGSAAAREAVRYLAQLDAVQR